MSFFRGGAARAPQARRPALRGHFEALERREMLSAAPVVTGVQVSSTSWTEAFVDYLAANSLGTGGYAIPTGSAAQTQALPWVNLDRIQVTFSEDVKIDAADFSLSGVKNTSYAVDNFHYDAQTHVATWTLAEYLPSDYVMIDLDADGLDPVVGYSSGEVLDGDWTNNVTSGSSGDGIAGGDLEFCFNVLPGDVSKDGFVSYYDYLYTRSRMNQNTTMSNYSALHDINGSGSIGYTDDVLPIIQQYYYTSQTTGSPLGASNDAPTTAGIGSVRLDTSDTGADAAATDIAIALFDVFDDDEDGSAQLDFEVTNNTDPTLTNSVSIDAATGMLNISPTSDSSGRTTLTVQATDSSGLSVSTDVTIDINRQNTAPIIVDFAFERVLNHMCTFSGRVTDSDDIVDGWQVVFTELINTRATLDEFGRFEFSLTLSSLQIGYVEATATDPHGLFDTEVIVAGI